ncbi:MAG: glucose-6-phosphate isomerase [Clostridia bacterium]|nr:glucose-6-phosphate isomerase [Clostridia bacterium]
MNNVSFDFGNMLAKNIGEHGVTDAEIAEAARALPGVHERMCAGREKMAWRLLPYDQDEIVKKIKETGKYINENFENFVVLGIGGSALGSKALFAGCCHLKYNELPRETRGGARFYIEDNVYPDKINALFDIIDVSKTAFHVITKSGNTVETMSQFMIVLSMLKERLGDGFKKNVFLTTDKEKGILRKIADENGWETFIVPDGVGGRFSVLSPVGLLSAAVLNIDIDALLSGARAMNDACVRPDLYENPAYMYALLYTVLMKKGVNISVLMPYSEALAPVSEWYCQLWAESLGKQVNLKGETVHSGQTPVRALGVTDQHSQIQLYNEGPFDKTVTFMGVEKFHTTVTIPKPPIPMPDLAYLEGKTLNTLIASEMRGTRHAVTSHGKPNNTITVESVNANTLGKLLFFFEMATAAAGEFLGINTFDQPGVEAGKIATFALMGRPGYEETAKELSKTADTEEKYTFNV